MKNEPQEKILHLVLKAKWYDMIDRGEKLEEYREIKPYWEKRLLDYKRLKQYFIENRRELSVKFVLFPNRPVIEDVAHAFPRGYTMVMFHRGYSNSRTMCFEITDICLGEGKPEWGAEPGKQYFVIKFDYPNLPFVRQGNSSTINPKYAIRKERLCHYQESTEQSR